MKNYLLVCCILWLSLCAHRRLHAQQLATAFSLSDTLPLRPDLRMATLPNGLRYYLLPNKTPENRAELRLVVHAGSLQEEDDQLGVAHFVEHMAFNGSRHFKKNELIDYLEHTGVRFGADLNAYTSFEETVYMLQARSDSLELLEKGLLILQDWAGGVSFEREEVDKERGVVIEEWRTRLSADQRLQQKTFPVLYEGSRYARRLPIGKPEIIEQIGLKRVKQFYKDWYRPDLMAVVATGDFDPAWMEAQIRARFGKLRMPARPRPREDYPIPPQPGTRYAMFTDPETPFTRATIRYKHKAQKVKTVGDFRQNIIRNLYNRMLNARMQDIGRQAHPPFTFAYAGYGNNISDLATYTVYAFTAEGEAIRGLEAVFGEVKRAQLHGFTSTELERHKAEIMANVERAYLERDKSASDNLAMGCVYHYLQGHSLLSPAQTLALYRQLLPGIGLQEVNEAGRNWITDENRVVAITGPEKEGVPLPTVAELEAMFERFERMQPPPYEDGVKAGPLLEQPLPPGQVVDTRYHDSVQVQEWKLANGVRVVLKATDFKNDEILMSSFSPGGHSLYSDADFHTASRAALLVSEGGVGNFDFLQLQKKLAGKRVNVGPYIDELYEGLSGSCSPAELETLLQLVYLYFTAPRKDPQALAAFVSQQKSFLQNMRASPGYHVAIESAKIRYGNHFRRQALPTLADIEAIDLDRALAIYRDRFADASDFTFVFVGNLEPDSVRDLIATYLGNLPATWRKEQGRDVGARLVRRHIDTTLVEGQTPKAQVHLTFHGDFDFSRPEKRYVFSSLMQLLNIKLRESMREEKGGVYGVSLRGSTFREPLPTYSINLRFTCDPARVEELIATAMQDIAQVQQKGASQEELHKVTAIQRQRVIRGLKENGFWLSQLTSRYKEGRPVNPIGLALLEKRIAALTAEAIRQAALTYFGQAYQIRLVWLPEQQAAAPTDRQEK